MAGRSRDVATAAECGHDLRPEGSAPAPVERRHDLETIADHDGPPIVWCRECGESGSIGSVNPRAECPDQGDGVPDPDGETTVPAP
jgi:hypothetical protein